MEKRDITRNDAIFFIDMLGYPGSRIDPKLHRPKPYYKILKESQSDDFLRFMNVYNEAKHILSERERQILDSIYAKTTYKEACKPHGITPERVRQIVYKSEKKIVKYLRQY